MSLIPPFAVVIIDIIPPLSVVIIDIIPPQVGGKSPKNFEKKHIFLVELRLLFPTLLVSQSNHNVNHNININHNHTTTTLTTMTTTTVTITMTATVAAMATIAAAGCQQHGLETLELLVRLFFINIFFSLTNIYFRYSTRQNGDSSSDNSSSTSRAPGTFIFY
jgi:hypothetical protein